MIALVSLLVLSYEVALLRRVSPELAQRGCSPAMPATKHTSSTHQALAVRTDHAAADGEIRPSGAHRLGQERQGRGIEGAVAIQHGHQVGASVLQAGVDGGYACRELRHRH